MSLGGVVVNETECIGIVFSSWESNINRRSGLEEVCGERKNGAGCTGNA